MITCVQQRLYFFFLRWLRVFGINLQALFLFYQAVLESIIRYGMTAWDGNLSVQLRARLSRLEQTAMRVIGRTGNPSLQAIYEQSVLG